MPDRTALLEQWEKDLSSYDGVCRRRTLVRLAAAVQRGAIDVVAAGWDVNLHAHTFYSYNARGYSPSQFAWLAKRRGLAAAGIVDFDVLDGVPEFLAAARLLSLRGCAGLETRVFVPAFADQVINSPGEPGIAYQVGAGFVSDRVPGAQAPFLRRLRETARTRNLGLVERVNAYLHPVEIDYERDVRPLTPAGNATERHLCEAYCRRAVEVFPSEARRTAFWSDKLDTDAGALDGPAGPALQSRLRAKTMKRGGAGYVAPDRGSFPTLAETNAFFAASGALPAVAWLDGSSEGEQRLEELLDTAMDSGAAAFNIVPDRNYTPGVEDKRLARLRDAVGLAVSRHLPVVVGTEMNSPGNKFADDLNSAELRPLRPVFLQGAYILHAHTVLQALAAMGFTSDWACRSLPDRADRCAFYEAFGRAFPAGREDRLSVDPDMAPAELLRRAAGTGEA